MVAPLASTAPSSTPTSGPAGAAALDEARKTAAASAQGQRAELNGQILQASLQVSIGAGNDSLALLYKSAIEQINERLAPELGANALQAAMGQDNSAEGTAGRILAQSTAFFDAYARQHQGEDPEAVLRNFVDLIRGGFEKGFAEAADILAGLGVTGEDSAIAADIQKTFELVQKGYDDFLNSRLAALQPQSQDSAGAASGA